MNWLSSLPLDYAVIGDMVFRDVEGDPESGVSRVKVHNVEIVE